jgi:hypothetical protein
VWTNVALIGYHIKAPFQKRYKILWRDNHCTPEKEIWDHQKATASLLGGCSEAYTRLTVDQEKNSGDEGADARDEIEQVTADMDSQKSQPRQDQIDAEQDPFQVTHFNFSLSLKREGLLIVIVSVTTP